MGSIDNVPFSYDQKANRNWWKYVIPQNFPAYKPTEIDEWDIDTILEHLAAIREMKRQNRGGEN